jgi:hypothetical protein
MNLSTDRALTVAKDFLKRMAQPRSHAEELGTTMLDEATVHRLTAAAKATKEAEDAAVQEEQKESTPFFANNNPGIPRAAPVPWTQQAAAAAPPANTAATAPPPRSLDSPAPMDVDT